MNTSQTMTPTTGALKKAPVLSKQNLIDGIMSEFRENPLKFLERAHAECDDVALVRFFATPSLVLFKPEYIKQVLQDHAKHYVKQKRTMNIIGSFSQQNVFTSDGDFWLKQRRMMQPIFHRQRLQGFGQVMVDSTLKVLQEWEARPATQPFIEIESEMSRLTMRIVGQSLFSEDLSDERSELGKAFHDADVFVGHCIRNLNPPLWVPTKINRMANNVNAILRKKIMGMVAERRANGNTQGDLLTMLMEVRDEETGQPMDDEQIRRESITMIAAGHETTARTMAWVFYLLSQHPDVELKLHAELERVLGGRTPTIDDVPNLVYTRQIIDETLRLYPPAYATGRDVAEEDNIDGYVVKKGGSVTIGIYATQRSPHYWERPNDFVPERFAPERANEIHKWAYLPFGGGPRVCIGQMFALTEAVLIAATIGQRYRLVLKPGHPVEAMPVFTLQTSHGLPMSLVAR